MPAEETPIEEGFTLKFTEQSLFIVKMRKSLLKVLKIYLRKSMD